MRFIGLFMLFVGSQILISCGSVEGEFTNLLKSRLKGPSSLMISKVTVNSKQTYACAVWNAKNSYGGYGEGSITSFKKESRSWAIREFSADVKLCQLSYFNAIDEHYRLYEELKDLLSQLEAQDSKFKNSGVGAGMLKNYKWINEAVNERPVNPGLLNSTNDILRNFVRKCQNLLTLSRSINSL